jgi:2-C-methyl-D-erythritol 4-phosphate cytidylyltransferase
MTNDAGAVLLAHAPDAAWSAIAGRPLLAWTARVFAQTPAVQETILVVATEQLQAARALVLAEGWTRIFPVASAGPRRRDAIRSGVAALAPPCRWVILHDASRPLITAELIATGLQAAQRTGAASASVPVKETIKRVRQGVVVDTLDRSRLALLQPPEIFERSLLEAIYDGLPPDTDSLDAASLAAAAGRRLVTFPGDPENFALATPSDLLLTERLLHSRAHL